MAVFWYRDTWDSDRTSTTSPPYYHEISCSYYGKDVPYKVVVDDNDGSVGNVRCVECGYLVTAFRTELKSASNHDLVYEKLKEDE